MMKKGIVSLSCGACLLVVSSLSAAAEINLVSHRNTESQLRDGMKLATGRMTCRETHTGFHVWMNARQDGGRPEHYIVQNSKGIQHELRVRIGGNGWISSFGEAQRGIFRLGKEEQAIFDVIVDGDQKVIPGEYMLSISGECIVLGR